MRILIDKKNKITFNITVLLYFISSNFYLLKSQGLTEKPVNPFDLYTSNFSEARKKNDEYQEWYIYNFKGVHRKNVFYDGIKDSLSCLISGLEGLPFAVNFHAQYNLPLPGSIKKINLDLVYGFLSYNEGSFYCNVIFNNHTMKLRGAKIPLSPTTKFGGKNWKLALKEIELDVPKEADNFIIQLKSGESSVAGSVVLGSLDLRLDGKDISDYGFNQNHAFSSKELRKIKSKTSKKLSISNSTRVLGIGESLHGNKEFQEQNYIITKENILKNDFKTLLIEASPVFAYRFNRYVHGDESALKDLTTVKSNVFSNSIFIKLLDFIKSYNHEHNKKVSISGFDILKNERGLLTLFEKVLTFFPNSPELKACIELLQNKGGIINPNVASEIKILLEEAISKSKSNRNVWEAYIYNYLLGWTQNRGGLGDELKYLRARDSIMANNVSFVLDNLLPENSKVILIGHLGHIAKNIHLREFKFQFTNSMGFFLSQKYGKKYTAIGLYTGSGSFWAKRYNGYNLTPEEGEYPISPPIGRSIEQLCTLIDKPSFYINRICRIPLLDKVFYERSQGTLFEPMQFEPTDLRKELDVIWFTRNSSHLEN